MVRATRRHQFKASDFVDWKDMKTPRGAFDKDKNWTALWKSPSEENSVPRKVLLKDYRSKAFFENERRVNEKIGVTNIEDDDGSENVSEIARYYGHFERQECISVYTGVSKCTETIYTLVFKYYEAEDLFDYISTNHPLRNTKMEWQPWNDDVKRIFKKMVYLSTELAKKGITHGDISTENYLIDGKGNIILIDFGNGSLDSHLKGTKGFKPMNLPPEFIENVTQGRYVDDNKEFLGEKCDVFGLGVALYILLAGLPIYQKPFDTHFNYWYFQGMRQYYETVLSKAPEEAKDLLPNLLEKNPKKRFSLEQILQHKYCIE